MSEIAAQNFSRFDLEYRLEVVNAQHLVAVHVMAWASTVKN